MSKKKKDRQRIWRGLMLGVGLLVLGGLGVLGWQWMAALHVEQIEIAGARHAEAEAVLELAQVDTGMALLEVDPLIVADRVRRHPWVADASVTRLPTGTLHIDVVEQVPVALVLDRSGRPAFYLNRDGRAMPLANGSAYPVPLLRDLNEAYHPVRPVQDERVRLLLAALAELDPDTDALISELELRDREIWLHTTPAGDSGSIPVRLGRDGFEEKLERLHAFWHQAVLAQPEKTFQQIDLRYHSQVVTREAVSDQPSAVSY